jgi:hypothetical protein
LRVARLTPQLGAIVIVADEERLDARVRGRVSGQRLRRLQSERFKGPRVQRPRDGRMLRSETAAPSTHALNREEGAKRTHDIVCVGEAA